MIHVETELERSSLVNDGRTDSAGRIRCLELHFQANKLKLRLPPPGNNLAQVDAANMHLLFGFHKL